MHTSTEGSIQPYNQELWEVNFSFSLKDVFTPLSTKSADERIADPENISVKHISKAFDDLESRKRT